MVMRYACNGRLRNAFYHWARTSIQHDAAAKRYYGVSAPGDIRTVGHSAAWQTGGYES